MLCLILNLPKSPHAVSTNHSYILSCTSSKTKSTEILSCSNHKSSCSLHNHESCHSLMRLFRYSIQQNSLLQSLQEQTIVSCASSDLKPNEIPSQKIHKHEPLSNAFNVPHKAPYSLKSFHAEPTNMDYSLTYLMSLKLLKSLHAASTNNNQSLILLMCFIQY